MPRKRIIFTNFIIVIYFILIWLIDFFKIDLLIIGVLKEILTIPFLLAQLVFLVLGIKYLLNYKKDFLALLSVILLAICTIITVGSFFW